MSPYEAAELTNYITNDYLRNLIIMITLISGSIVVLRELLSFFLGTGRRSVDKLAVHLLSNAHFKPINEAVSEIPKIKKDVETLKEDVSTATKNIDILTTVSLATLGDRLNQIFYELMESSKFNATLYGDFMNLYDTYVEMGGNGAIQKRQRALQTKWEAEIMKNG